MFVRVVYFLHVVSPLGPRGGAVAEPSRSRQEVRKGRPACGYPGKGRPACGYQVFMPLMPGKPSRVRLSGADCRAVSNRARARTAHVEQWGLVLG